MFGRFDIALGKKPEKPPLQECVIGVDLALTNVHTPLSMSLTTSNGSLVEVGRIFGTYEELSPEEQRVFINGLQDWIEIQRKRWIDLSEVLKNL